MVVSVSASRHRLNLERFEHRSVELADFMRHNALQIIFDRENVDHV